MNHPFRFWVLLLALAIFGACLLRGVILLSPEKGWTAQEARQFMVIPGSTGTSFLRPQQGTPAIVEHCVNLQEAGSANLCAMFCRTMRVYLQSNSDGSFTVLDYCIDGKFSREPKKIPFSEWHGEKS